MNGGQYGDLIVKFEVEQHPFYQRHGDDVFCRLSLPYPHAVLGTFIEIPSIYGETLRVEIQPGIQHKQVVKVSEEGFFSTGAISSTSTSDIDSSNHHKTGAAAGSKRGDMYLQIFIEIPTVLEEDERQLLATLATKPNFKPKFPIPLSTTSTSSMVFNAQVNYSSNECSNEPASTTGLVSGKRTQIISPLSANP